MASYVVDPLSYARASLLVLLDKRPKTDGVFVHGSPTANDEIDTSLLEMAVSMTKSGETDNLVINGLTDEACYLSGRRLAYPGCDTWGRTIQGFGLSKFLKILPSLHTAAESDNLIKLALEMGWKNLVVMSYPHHILRCMLQMVFCLKRAGSDLKVYTRTLPSIDWQICSEKTVLGRASFQGTLIDVHVREEYERLIKYADKDGTGYTPHATLEELIDYCQWRDS